MRVTVPDAWRAALADAASLAENSRHHRQPARLGRPDRRQFRLVRVRPDTCVVVHPVNHRSR